MMEIFKTKISLRTRLFLAMVLLVFTACIMILGATYFQYNAESESYNQFRMDRKEKQLLSQINFLTAKNDLIRSSQKKWMYYKNDFEAVRTILSVDYSG